MVFDCEAQVASGLLTAVCCLALAACSTEHRHAVDELTDSALQVMTDARVHRTEGGRLQMMLEAPVIKKYDAPKPKTLFVGTEKQRVQLRIYDSEAQVKALIEAGNAVSFDDRDIMEAHDSVVVIDYRGGDTIYLEDLIWNSSEDRIYSDHPVRSRNGNRITEGDGFVSNQNMDDMHILHQRGVIEFEDE